MFELGYFFPLGEEQRQNLATRMNVPLVDIEFFEYIMDSDDEDVLKMHDINDETQEYYDSVNFQEDLTKLHSFVLDEVMPTLNGREQFIIRHRLLDDDMRVEEIADHFNVSKAHIYQTEKKLFQRIQSGFKSKYNIA
jgi:DNA-directed RNA polymerase specialized sigma subunit